MEVLTESILAPLAAPAASRRSQQKEETHERIVRASLRLFETRGFAATRTQDIAEEAGISHGSIFVHFRTRDELLVHVCRRFLGSLDSRVRSALRGSADLEGFLRGHVEALSAHEALLTRLVQELSALPPAVRVAYVDTQTAVSAHLKVVLHRDESFAGLGAEEHAFLFHAWMGVITYYLLHRDNFTTSEQVLKEQGSEIVTRFLKLASGRRGLTQ